MKNSQETSIDSMPTKSRLNHHNKRFGALIGLVTSIMLTKDIPGARGHIPEPFDVMNHGSNLNGSVFAGYAAGVLADSLVNKSKRFQEMSPETRLRRTRLAMIGAGLAVGVVINTVAETKWGLRLVGLPPTGTDPIDFAWGVLGAGGAGALPGVNPTHLTPNQPSVTPEATVASR